MTDTYRSGQGSGQGCDHAALVGYLYDDCEPGERDAIAAHVQGCRACAGELEALGGTRRQLAAWTPPEARLGFRIAPASDESSGVSPFTSGARTRTGWWQQPLPAWAQLAAAVAIFASGLAIGTTRGSAAAPAPAVELASAEVRAALTSLERRLAGVEQVALREPARAAGLDVVTNEATILQKFRHELASSEERVLRAGQQELALRVLELAESQTRQAEQIETNVKSWNNQLETNMATVFQQVASFQR